MNSKPDIEYEERGDISLLSEIIINSMYWQVTLTRDWIFKLQQYHRTGGQMQAVLNPKAELPV
jgi:hypothetical protein